MAEISKLKLPNGDEYDLKVSVEHISGQLPITKGGTGASTAPAARTNLGLGTAAILDSTSSVEKNLNQLPTSDAVANRITDHIIISDVQPTAQITGDAWFVLQQYSIDPDYTQVTNDYGGNTAYINSSIEGA